MYFFKAIQSSSRYKNNWHCPFCSPADPGACTTHQHRQDFGPRLPTPGWLPARDGAWTRWQHQGLPGLCHQPSSPVADAISPFHREGTMLLLLRPPGPFPSTSEGLSPPDK